MDRKNKARRRKPSQHMGKEDQNTTAITSNNDNNNTRFQKTVFL